MGTIIRRGGRQTAAPAGCAGGRGLVPRGVEHTPRSLDGTPDEGGSVMRGTLDVHRDGDTLILALRGEHDIDTAPELRAELEDALAAGTAIVVDLSQAEFIDSTVLGAIIYGHERRQAFGLVVPLGCPSHRLCEMVELGGIVPIYDSVPDAVADLVKHGGRTPRGVS
jgi:anti-sigma B factor antagonist